MALDDYIYDGTPLQVDDESELFKLARTVLGSAPVQYIAQTLDKPGRAIRGLLGGSPSELLNLLPFSDTLGITDPANTVGGRDLLRQWGMADQQDTWGNFLGGMGLEVLLDPLNAVTLGTKTSLTALGREAAKAGTLAKTAGGRLAEQAGLMGVRTPWWYDMTAGNLGAPTGSMPLLTGATGQAVLDFPGQVAGGLREIVDRTAAGRAVTGGLDTLGAYGRSMFVPGSGIAPDARTTPTLAATIKPAEQAVLDATLEGRIKAISPIQEAYQHLAEKGVTGAQAERLVNRTAIQMVEGTDGYIPKDFDASLVADVRGIVGNAIAPTREVLDKVRDAEIRAGKAVGKTDSPWGTNYFPRQTMETGASKTAATKARDTVFTDALWGGSLQMDDLIANETLAGMASKPRPAGVSAEVWNAQVDAAKKEFIARQVEQAKKVRTEKFGQPTVAQPEVPTADSILAKHGKFTTPEAMVELRDAAKQLSDQDFAKAVTQLTEEYKGIGRAEKKALREAIGAQGADKALERTSLMGVLDALMEARTGESLRQEAPKFRPQLAADPYAPVDAGNAKALNREAYAKPEVKAVETQFHPGSQYNTPGTDYAYFNKEGGRLSTEITDGVMKVVDVRGDKNVKGIGKELYEAAIEYAAQHGLKFHSDTSVSQSAAKVYDYLEGKGYQVVRNQVEPGKAAAGPVVYAKAGEGNPAFEVIPKKPANTPTVPAKPAASTTVGELPYSARISDEALQTNWERLADVIAEAKPEVVAAKQYYRGDFIGGLTHYADSGAKIAGTGQGVLAAAAKNVVNANDAAYAANPSAYVRLDKALKKIGTVGKDVETVDGTKMFKQGAKPTIMALLKEQGKTAVDVGVPTPARVINRELKKLYIPRDVAEKLSTEFMGPGYSKTSAVMDTVRGYTDAMRSFMTQPWVPFHTRNAYEGVLQSNLTTGISPQAYADAVAYRTGSITDAAKRAELQQYATEAFATKGALRGQMHEQMGQSVVGKELKTTQPFTPQTGRSTTDAIKEFLGDYRPSAAAEKGQAYLTLDPKKNVLVQQGMAASTAADDVQRLAQFIDLRRKGYAPQSAADLVSQTHLDYSALTPFEQNLRSLVPFYSFSRRNLARTAAQAQDPGALASLLRAGAGAGQETYIPGYVTPGTAVPVPGAEEGKQRYVSGLSTPFDDELMQAAIAGASGNVGEAGKRLLSTINPLAKLGITLGTGRQLYSGRRLDEYSPSGIAGFLPNKAGNILSEVLGATPVGRLATTVNTAVGGKDQNILLRLLTGVRTTDVDPTMANQMAARDAVSQALKQTGMVNVGETIYPKREYRDEPPAELSALMELMQAIRAQGQQYAQTRNP